MSHRQIERIGRELYGVANELTNHRARLVMSHEVSRIKSQSEFDALHAQRMMERTKRASI